MATLDAGFFPETKKASLGTGIVGEAIISPSKTSTIGQPLFIGLKARGTKLPSLPPKRQSQSPIQMSMYKTQSMNPYKAVVATNHPGNKDVVPASKYIGIHHCSIEFNAGALRPTM